ncbi:hypothetical protein X975_23903, partial [Stegodyphus mimosarum]
MEFFWYTLFLILTTLGNLTSASECNKENIKACMIALQPYLDAATQVEDKDKVAQEFCQTFQKGQNCLKDISESCKKSETDIAAITRSLSDYLERMCELGSEIQNTYPKLTSCFKEHESEFKKCASVEFTGKTDESLQKICKEMKTVLCLAGKSKKTCGDDGQRFGSAVEKVMHEDYSSICGGASKFVVNSWIFILVLFVSYWISRKA